MGFRAPAVAGLLFGASLAVGGWALLAAGGLGAARLVGLTAHRRGLLVLAGGLILLPLASGNVGHAELDVPCWLAAAVLLRIGLVRWDGLGEPDREVARTATPTPAVATPAAAPGAAPGATAPPPAGCPAALGAAPPPVARSARVAGRMTARAGTVLGEGAATVLPRAARAAGRAIGRSRHVPPRR